MGLVALASGWSAAGARMPGGQPLPFTSTENNAEQNPSGAVPAEAAGKIPPATRGQKLVLKNGDFQLVRSYERKGDKVRYLSAERGDWEELPAALVDWEATAKAAAEDAKSANSLVKTVHQEQVERQAEVPYDVDVSLRVGGGVFLPPDEGMFAVQGKAVSKLEQVASESKLDKKNVIGQVISPVPIVPTKHNIVLTGAHAKMRVTANGSPLEFFLREPPPDQDHPSTILATGARSDSGPDVELVVAAVKGNKRQIESISVRFGNETSREKKVVSVQRWDVAPNVFRFTLSEALPPGEYVLAELLPDNLNLYVWDFGVDAGGTAADGKVAK
jgi:hypothetical protein